jgi:hypothetical protein
VAFALQSAPVSGCQRVQACWGGFSKCQVFMCRNRLVITSNLGPLRCVRIFRSSRRREGTLRVHTRTRCCSISSEASNPCHKRGTTCRLRACWVWTAHAGKILYIAPSSHKQSLQEDTDQNLLLAASRQVGAYVCGTGGYWAAAAASLCACVDLPHVGVGSRVRLVSSVVPPGY